MNKMTARLMPLLVSVFVFGLCFGLNPAAGSAQQVAAQTAGAVLSVPGAAAVMAVPSLSISFGGLPGGIGLPVSPQLGSVRTLTPQRLLPAQGFGFVQAGMHTLPQASVVIPHGAASMQEAPSKGRILEDRSILPTPELSTIKERDGAFPELQNLAMTRSGDRVFDGMAAAKRLPQAQEAKTGSSRMQSFESPGTIKLIVRLDGGPQPLSHDAHLGLLDARSRVYAQEYGSMHDSMLMDLKAAGMDLNVLKVYEASPVATYRRINMTTLNVPKDNAPLLRAVLEAKGFKVYDNARREIIKPVPSPRESSDPNAPIPSRGDLTIDETLALSTMDKVQKEMASKWGLPPVPNAGMTSKWVSRVLRLLGIAIPQPPAAVIDTGVDLKHKLLKQTKESKNMTDGPNIDDDGHGSWTHSMVLRYAPWAMNTTHYKTFLEGGATLDDILKALTTAGNDGNIVMSNSWGSDEGDPESPDSLLVTKLAKEGHIMVFAAGNAGPGANTIGSPAIAYYRDAKTGAPRVLSIAATDKNKKVVYFSSRGPGSEKTSRDPKYKDWPRRPDAGEQGYNTESAWPSDKDPDRIDPAYGPVKSISGTSMSTPKFAGTILMLAQAFGVVKVGEELDKIVNAVVSTLVKTGESVNLIGDGFSSAWAAYQKCIKMGLEPVMPRGLAKLTLRLMGWAVR